MRLGGPHLGGENIRSSCYCCHQGQHYGDPFRPTGVAQGVYGARVRLEKGLCGSFERASQFGGTAKTGELIKQESELDAEIGAVLDRYAMGFSYTQILNAKSKAVNGLLKKVAMTECGNILIVDDESDSLVVLTAILAAEGYQVRCANSGELALASVKALLPHLVLLDISMPGLDGFEVCRRLKASQRTRDVPLMFISSVTEVEERVAGLAMGAVDFITKPFRREELLARVRTHLELGRLRANLQEQVQQKTTELRATLERLRESEARFRHMADTAPVMIWVSGPDKLFTFFNQRWLTFTGRTLEEELNDGWASNIHPEDLERCLDIYSSSFDDRNGFQMEYRMRRTDGQYRWLLASGVPRDEGDAVFAGYIGSCLDITDLRRAHEENLTRQHMETVGTLASGIAHDFNNLLGGVLAHAELALATIAEDANPEEELQRICLGAIRGAEIVRQLMVYAREEAEELEFVDVSQTVQDMLELLKVSVSKHVKLETSLVQRIPVVQANPSQIRQIVMNLIYNASEAIGDRDGVVRVTTDHVTIGSGACSVTDERLAAGEYVLLDVSDTGRGMTPDVKDRIFDRFFTTKPTGSHGLGLSAVRDIVDRLQGTVRVSSAPGEGTTFQILLPGERQSVEATRATIVRVERGTLTSLDAMVLIVEDEDLLRQGVAKALGNTGLSVIEAADGSAALEVLKARKGDIDMLLLDITLPGASSREVYDEAMRLKADLPVIVTSAKSAQMAAALLGRRIDRFLRKPYSLVDLTGLIGQILSSRQPSGFRCKVQKEGDSGQ